MIHFQFFYILAEDGQPVVVSYREHNSLAYGVDWGTAVSSAHATEMRNRTAQGNSDRIVKSACASSYSMQREVSVSGKYRSKTQSTPDFHPSEKLEQTFTNISNESPKQRSLYKDFSGYVIGSCSFYDHSLHLWKWQW